MCLRDRPWSFGPCGPVGQYTFVRISREARRWPFSASPSTVSAAVLAYTSAVSKVVIPASMAACTQRVAVSFSIWDPWVNQLP